MLHESDTIYKNVGIAVCVAFLIYVLVSVVQIQYDVGSRIAKFGSGIIKEGFIEGNRNKNAGDKKSKKLNDTELIRERYNRSTEEIEDIIISNYNDAKMNDDDDKLDGETVKLVIALMKAKLREVLSEKIKDFAEAKGEMDFATSSETNNTITLLKSMIAHLENPM